MSNGRDVGKNKEVFDETEVTENEKVAYMVKNMTEEKNRVREVEQ